MNTTLVPTLVSVTAAHIAGGKCRHPSKCAVALAVEETLMPGLRVAVGHTCWGVYSQHECLWESPDGVPPEVVDFIRCFDGERFPINGLQPFQFTLNIPAFALRS